MCGDHEDRDQGEGQDGDDLGHGSGSRSGVPPDHSESAVDAKRPVKPLMTNPCPEARDGLAAALGRRGTVTEAAGGTVRVTDYDYDHDPAGRVVRVESPEGRHRVRVRRGDGPAGEGEDGRDRGTLRPRRPGPTSDGDGGEAGRRGRIGHGAASWQGKAAILPDRTSHRSARRERCGKGGAGTTSTGSGGVRLRLEQVLDAR